MSIYNENNERIYILHMPGKGTVENLRDLIEKNKKNIIIKDDDISIIVLATKNYINTSPVIEQLNYNNIEYYNGAENVDESNWSNSLKVGYILNNLLKIKTKYTLILDSRDTIICNNLDLEFINQFKKLKHKVIFNASASRHPSWSKIKKIDDKYKNCLSSKPFLNSGVCFGETSHIISLYKKAQETYIKYKSLNVCDQFLIKLTIVNNRLLNIIGLDNKDNIFKCIHQDKNKPDFILIEDDNNYIIKNNLHKPYKGKRFKKTLNVKIEKSKLILYPNYKNREKDVMEFYNNSKRLKNEK